MGAWQLIPDEMTYIDRQQAINRLRCPATVRVIVLANPIRDIVDDRRCMTGIVADGRLTGF